MKVVLFIKGVFLVFLAIILPKNREDPFFKLRCFKYYQGDKLVAVEYRSCAEPQFYYLRKSGLGVPKYDKIVDWITDED